MPAELDEVERRIMQLEIEREALRKEKRPRARRSAWRTLERELAELGEQRDAPAGAVDAASRTSSTGGAT